MKYKELATTNGIYFEASYSNYYPSPYRGIYNYYAYLYAYGSYYDSFGGFIPTSTSRSYSDYVLETVAYSLDEAAEQQLAAVITTNIKDPKDGYKTTEKYVDNIMKSLEQKV